MQFKSRPKRKVIINITSLIDILFLLLIFFMVSSTFLEQPGMKLNLPKAKSTQMTNAKGVTLEISENGDILLNGEFVQQKNLKKKLSKALSATDDHKLILKADELVTHGKVVKLMDIARQAGARKLVVATRNDD
jgi:biopolymer transport protein ExbD